MIVVWHVGAGLGLQFVENYDQISTIANAATTYQNCDAWGLYTKYNLVLQEDSGV